MQQAAAIDYSEVIEEGGSNMKQIQSGFIALVPAAVSALSAYVLCGAEFLQTSMAYLP
jgi:hypothetical protein